MEYLYTLHTCTSNMHAVACIQTSSVAVDGASLAQTTQETIPFTTVAFSFYGFLLMCSLVFLCWASSPRRLWSGENCLCLLQHTSKRALLRKGKVLREPADCLPIMHRCLLDRTIFREIYSTVGMDNTLAPTMQSVTMVWKWLELTVCFCSCLIILQEEPRNCFNYWNPY